MNWANFLMDSGTWILCIAAVPQLISIYKNRNDLSGYSVSGTLALFLGLLLITGSFILMNMWISVGAQVIPLILWSTASYYVWKGKK